MEDYKKEPQNEKEEFVEEDLDDSVVAEEYQGDVVKKLREKVKTAEEKAREYLTGWQKERAEIANARRRDEEAKQEFMKFAKATLVEELIPVLDSFNIALSHGHEGLEPLYNQLFSVLKAQGLEELDSRGGDFNPREHEALQMVPTQDKGEDHKVLEVLQKGYKLHGKVIRPAKVKVGEFINE